MSRCTFASVRCALLFVTFVEGARLLVPRDSWAPGAPGDKEAWQANSELIALRNQTGMDFVFCALPKNGCTVWKQLMLRASNVSHWNTTNKSLIHNPTLSGLDLLHSKDILRMMGPGSTAYKAVIVRDPAVRLLSSYLDRCIDNQEWRRCLTYHPISFEEVVSNYEARDPEKKVDVHFRNQTGMCGLRFQDFASWDFVGKYEDFVNVSEDILREVNLWHLYGEDGWGADGKGSFGSKEQPMDNHPGGEHHTEDRVCEHYTPELLHRVHQLYRPDYKRFNYSIVPWLEACYGKWGAAK